MSIEEIMTAIRSLANSQGFYGRLYQGLWNLRQYDPERWAEVKEKLEGQCFKDELEMVLYFES